MTYLALRRTLILSGLSLVSLTLAGLAVPDLLLSGRAVAQPAPDAMPSGPGEVPGMVMRDPFGDGTVARKDAEAQIVARFAALDRNGDGALSAEELAAARAGGAGRGAPDHDRPEHDGPGHGGMGPQGMGAGRMARMLDANGDGVVSRDEFVAGSLRRFDMMDADHDGQLTKAERAAAMEAMRARMEERMRAMMSGDGPQMGD